MRHPIGALLGLVLAPVIWTLLGIGGSRLQADLLPGQYRLTAVGLLALAGLLLGLLLGLRTSPLGPVVAGLVFLVPSVFVIVLPEAVTGLLRIVPVGYRGQLGEPLFSGVLFVLGVALVVPVLSVGRWRSGRPGRGLERDTGPGGPPGHPPDHRHHGRHEDPPPFGGRWLPDGERTQVFGEQPRDDRGYDAERTQRF